MHGTVCNYTLMYAHLNGIHQGWGVIATMNGIVYQPPWTFRPSYYARRLPIDTCLVSKKFYKSPLSNYVFGIAMGGLLLKQQNVKKVKLIFGHPVYISSRHSNLNFAHHSVIYWLFQNGANKNQHQDSYQRETVPDKFVFFFKIGKAKKSNRVSKIRVCMCLRYVLKDFF